MSARRSLAQCEPGDPLTALFRTQGGALARAGSVQAEFRHSGARQLGPYYRLVWRVAGRQRTFYLGRAGPRVDEVRSRLAQLQAARHQDLQSRRGLRQLRAFLAAQRRRINELLQLRGLHLQGHEVRGQRTAARPVAPVQDGVLL